MKYLKLLILPACLFFSLPVFSQETDGHEKSVAKQLDALEQPVKTQSSDWEKTGRQEYQDAKNLDDKTLQERQDYLRAKGYDKSGPGSGRERISHEITVKTTLDAYLAGGKQQFAVIDDNGQKISQLDFPVKGPLYTFSGEISFYDKFALVIAVTNSSLNKHTGIDRDWDPSMSQDTWFESGFSSKPDINIYNARVSYRFLAFDPGKDYFWSNIDPNEDKFYLDAFGGWMNQTDKYPIRDGEWQIENWGPPTDTLDGLDSYYHIRYDGPLAGIVAQGIAKNGLIGRAELSLGFLRAKAKGYWNLRDYSFDQRGNGFSLGARYDLFYSIRSFKFGIGWKYSYYKIKKLKESGTEPGYSYSDQDDIRNEIFRTSGPVFSLEYIW